jgi:hypothetical protein
MTSNEWVTRQPISLLPRTLGDPTNTNTNNRVEFTKKLSLFRSVMTHNEARDTRWTC